MIFDIALCVMCAVIAVYWLVKYCKLDENKAVTMGDLNTSFGTYYSFTATVIVICLVVYKYIGVA